VSDRSRPKADISMHVQWTMHKGSFTDVQ